VMILMRLWDDRDDVLSIPRAKVLLSDTEFFDLLIRHERNNPGIYTPDHREGLIRENLDKFNGAYDDAKRHHTLGRLRGIRDETLAHNAENSVRQKAEYGYADELLEKTISQIAPLDDEATRKARERQDTLIKPQGSLGVLEEISIRLAGIQGKPIPVIKDKVIITMAGDHGVVEEKVGNWPQEVTAQMVFGFIGGHAGINVVARYVGARVMVVDMGATTTDIAIYEETELIYCATIPVGSMHITNDIAIGLRTNLDIAEVIKLKYGSVITEKIRDSETINLSAIDPAEDEKVSRKEVCEIIEARVSEIFDLIKAELNKVGKEGLLPAGSIFTGGGSDIEGLTELARKELRLPATIGYPTGHLSGMLDKLDNPIYACAVGLILWGAEENQPTSGRTKIDFGKFGGVFDRFRGILRNFGN